jgi:two-component sensor histidine kinase
MLRGIQLTITLALGLLGLLACWYIHHTISILRANFADLDAQKRRLEGLFDTASHLSVSAPEAMHGFLTERVATMLDATKVALWSYDARRHVLSPLTPAHGFDSAALRGLEVPVCTGDLLSELLFKNKTVMSADLQNEPRAQPYRTIVRNLAISSVLAAPLIAHGRPVGLICVYDKIGATPFTADDSRVLQIFAGQAAFVLHSADLYARSVARGEQIKSLATISASLSKSLDLQQALITFVREARALIPFDAVRVALLPAETSELAWSVAEQKFDPAVDLAAEASAETVLTRRIRGHNGPGHQPHGAMPSGQTRDVAQAESESADELARLDVWSVRSDEIIRRERRALTELPVAERVLSAGRALLIAQPDEEEPEARRADRNDSNGIREEDAYDAPWPSGGEAGAQAPGAGSVIATPLWAHGALIGVLQLEGDSPEALTRTHLVLARQLAGQLATVLQNARLYQEARRRAEQLQWGMQETHHRIKNNLQAVAAILDLHLMDAGASASPDSLRHALLQVRSIAAVHDLLDEDIQSGSIPMRRLLDTLAPALVSGPAAGGKAIDLEIDAGEERLPIRVASAIALTVNELISNAIRHGGRGREAVAIRVEMQRESGRLRLTVRDDGPGFPKDFGPAFANVGWTLVEMLIERDLGGAVVVGDCGPGAEVTVTVPFA